MIITDIKFFEEYYDVTFDESGNVEKVFLDVGSKVGYQVDLIDVTTVVSQLAIEHFQRVYQDNVEEIDLVKADRFNDDPDNWPSGAA